MKKCLNNICSDHNIDQPNWCDSRVNVVTCYKKPTLMDDSEPVAKSPAAMAGYVADLEAFMTVVSSKLKCLPSFADPRPDEGNEHVIRKLDELLKRAT